MKPQAASRPKAALRLQAASLLLPASRLQAALQWLPPQQAMSRRRGSRFWPGWSPCVVIGLNENPCRRCRSPPARTVFLVPAARDVGKSRNREPSHRSPFLQELPPDTFLYVLEHDGGFFSAQRLERGVAHHIHDRAARQLVLIGQPAEIDPVLQHGLR